MTLEEAKKILKKEFPPLSFSFHKTTEPFDFNEDNWFVGEKAEVIDAFRALAKEGIYIAISNVDYEERKARLGRPTDVPSSDTHCTFNPALKEAASEFNDALLDEQAKKITNLEKYNKEMVDAYARTYDKLTEKEAMIEALEQTIAYRNNEIEELAKKANKYDVLIKQFKHLSDVLHKKNLKIEELRKESSKHLRDKISTFNENQELAKENGEYKKAVEALRNKISDLTIGKIDIQNIRLKEESESAQKYANKLADACCELRELKKKLANITVNNVDAQALKSAESALVYKEKEIKKLQHALVEKDAIIQEKDEHIRYWKIKQAHTLVDKDKVIEDLGKELAETKKKLRECQLEKKYNSGRKDAIDWERNAEAIKLYVNRASKERLWHSIDQDVCNEKELSFIVKHDGKRVKYALRFEGNDVIYECSDPDKKPRIPTLEEPKSNASMKQIMEDARESFKKIDKYLTDFLVTAGYGGGNGILDQMEVNVDLGKGESKTGVHIFPTEDNPEEIKIKEALKIIKKAMKDGHTVVIDYDDAADIINSHL